MRKFCFKYSFRECKDNRRFDYSKLFTVFFLDSMGNLLRGTAKEKLIHPVKLRTGTLKLRTSNYELQTTNFKLQTTNSIPNRFTTF